QANAQRVWRQMMLGFVLLWVGDRAEQNLYGLSTHLIPIDLHARQTRNLLAAGTHDAEVLGHSQSPTRDLLGDEPGQGIVETVKGTWTRGPGQPAFYNLPSPGFSQVGQQLPAAMARQVGVTQTLSVALQAPGIELRLLPMGKRNSPMTQ